MISGDYHTHHFRCGHARGTIEEYVRAALDLGLEEIGITDHAPIYWIEGDHALPGSAMPRSQLPAYVEEVLHLRERYWGRIRVLLGLEADYAPGFEEVYRDVLAAFPFDYVIGSVHYSGGFHIYDRRRWGPGTDPEAVYAEYFRLVRESARSGLFDVLGHISGITVYGDRPSREFLETEFDRTAAEVAASGAAIEVNTSGIRKGQGEPFPAGPLLRRLQEAGVPVAYGSDCHHPSEVGFGREEALPLVRGGRMWRPEMAARGTA